MPIIDKTPLLEASESLKEYREEFNAKQQRKLNESAREKEKLEEMVYFGAKEKRLAKKRAVSAYTESLKNDLLSSAIKGVYIGALMENKALTDDGIALASSLVDNYVNENGATNLLRKMEGKTYALDYIRCYVEGTYEKILTEADDDEDEENKVSDDSDENTDSEDTAEEESPEEEEPEEDEDDDDDSSDDSEPEDDDNNDDDSEDSDDEDESKDDAPTPEVDNPKDITPDDSGDDSEEPSEEELPDPEEIEEPEKDKKEMLDDLAQDDDINHAVNLIANRVADAEQEFIKKNTEDKKAIEDIASKVTERIKGAEGDASKSEEEVEEIKQEATRMGQIQTNKLKDRKINTVYEQITMNLTSSIVKDNVLRENYTEENGRLDMDSVMESVYCIYGFLETVNTLQLENVDAEFIRKELEEM